MSRGAKENWFESPHVKNGFWFFHEEKNDLFNLSKQSANDRNLNLTPSRNSKASEIQKNRNTPYNHSSEISQTEQSRFDDVNLPDMFLNTKVQKQVINQKINFEDSSVIQEQEDYVTPERHHQQSDQSFIKDKKYLANTTAKKSNFYYFEEKKCRPKEKGLRMLSQKAYQIVLKMNGATYKEVANVLVDQLALEDNIQIDGKDEQNIKRRVYDALNVLIALGVLKKDGRKIFGVHKNGLSVDLQAEQIYRTTEQLNLKQYRIVQKLKQHRSILTRFQMIKALIKRNGSLHKHLFRDKIEFPFIAIGVSEQDEKKVSVKSQSFEILSSQKVIQPFGDLDAISFLRSSLKAYIQ